MYSMIFVFGNTVEHRGRNFEAQCFGGDTEVGLQEPVPRSFGWHPERVEADVDWRSVFKEGMSASGTIVATTPLLP